MAAKLVGGEKREREKIFLYLYKYLFSSELDLKKG